jgi:hypothetical protein
MILIAISGVVNDSSVDESADNPLINAVKVARLILIRPVKGSSDD